MIGKMERLGMVEGEETNGNNRRKLGETREEAGRRIGRKNLKN